MSKIIKISLVIFLIIIILLFSLYNKNYLQLHFLDVGQGDAILIRTPQGQNILIDGGADNLLLHRLGESMPWWDGTIDYLVISHYHADHMMGLMELLNKYKVKNILVTAHQPDDFLFSVWQKSLEKYSLQATIVFAGDSWQLAEDLSMQVISADSQHEDYNDNSLVLKLKYKNISVLLTGDLPSVEEVGLLHNGFDLSSEILKVAHHGSKYSSSLEFLQAVRPKLCIIQSGINNKFNHPHPETLERLSQVDCQVLRNDLEGIITILSDGQTWWSV
ncbi:MBL fold metallo-hydrolase [bacterium]|mgnify:CR=1 FL=1|jgi:competence protein ComEC|nr:MBL fold metallo-hydrolase [bacterium]MBT4648854.1 MBL fold metallo-hydrolase [bacterium]